MRSFALIGLVCLGGCGEFERYEALRSSDGIVATIAVPTSKDAFTICFAGRPLPACSPGEAAVYSYRGLHGSQRWIGGRVFLVEQLGGEIRKAPAGRVRVGDKEIAVRIDHRPCRTEPRSVEGRRTC